MKLKDVYKNYEADVGEELYPDQEIALMMRFFENSKGGGIDEQKIIKLLEKFSNIDFSSETVYRILSVWEDEVGDIDISPAKQFIEEAFLEAISLKEAP